MRTQNKTIAIGLCIIAIMISTSIRAQTIILDSNRTINVALSFLSVKEKLMNVNDQDTTKVSILWKDKKTIGFINETDPEKKRFWIYYEGVSMYQDHVAESLIRDNTACPAWTTPTIKIKKKHQFKIVMKTEWTPGIGNKEWFFIMNRGENGGFYIKNKDGGLCVNGKQVSIMTPEEMKFFGEELYNILQILNK